MQIITALLSLIVVSGTIRDIFPDFSVGTRFPRDVAPGCYGGRLPLDARQFFFDSDNFEWIVEVSVGIPDFDTANIFIRRIDPAGEANDEQFCMDEIARVERDVDSGIISEITLGTSDCLKVMAKYVMLEEEDKLDYLRLTWMRSRYVFGLSAMALLPRRKCEFIDVQYEASEVLLANGTLPNDDEAQRFAETMTMIETVFRP